MRVILHPGFHKTGTKTLQRGLQENAALLAPALRVLFTNDILEATNAARRYSRRPERAALTFFQHELATVLETVDTKDTRPLLITSEDLSGHLPGKFGIAAYDASPKLVGAAVETFQMLWGQDAQIDIWYTTRAPQAWLQSAYYQVLRGSRLTKTLDAFTSEFARAAKLREIVEKTRAHVGAGIRVHDAPLEMTGKAPLGPLGTFLQTFGFPTTDVVLTRVQNIQPDGLAQELLDLNRSALDDAALAETKRRVIRTARAKQTKLQNG